MILELKDISVSFEKCQVLQHLNLVLHEGEILRLDGPSGIGKTTLMLTAAGLLKPQQGTVVNTFQRQAFVFQDDRLLPWLTALQNVTFAMDAALSAAEAEWIAREWLERLGLQQHLHKKADQLSGGQCRRVNLARALASSPQLLFLDEAFASLDADSMRQALELVLEWQAAGGTLMMTAHDSSLDGIPCRSVNLQGQFWS